MGGRGHKEENAILSRHTRVLLRLLNVKKLLNEVFVMLKLIPKLFIVRIILQNKFFKNNIQDIFAIFNAAFNLHSLIKGHILKYEGSIFITILYNI